MTDPHSGQRPLPDLIAGRYRIVSRLGVGGMGIVYKATDIQLNRAVAVKALEDRRLLFPGSAGKLRAEALAAASLDHPYICKVYELVETPHDTFIVMEFVDGETLAAVLKRGVLPLARTLQIGREIAEGLANAHARGLVHRDVKPANVMVTPSGHVKLLDFGVAGADVESTPGDRTHTVSPQRTLHAGTPQYMAPEQASGQPVTARADLFSLGVLLYECIAGSLPFSGTTTYDYVRHVMQSAPRRLDRVAPETPADLVDLIDQCLEKVPASRPVSADAVVAQLRRLSEALASAGGSLRTAGQARSGRRWKIVAAVAIAAAAVAVGWRYVWTPGSTSAPTRQLRSFVTSAAQEFDSQISPDAQWVSFISTNGTGSQIMVQRVDGGEPRPLTLSQGTPVSQVWSPDGTQLACVVLVNNDWLLQIYPAFFGGAPLQTVVLDTHADVPRIQVVDLLRWIGRTIYLEVSADAISLRRIDIDRESAMTNLSASWKLPGSLQGVDVRPDGGGLVLQLQTTQPDLWVAGMDGSAARAITHDAFFERHPLWNGRGDRVIFQSNRGGQNDLWDVDPHTGVATQLTIGEGEKTATSTSPDGSLISFEQVSQEARLWLWGSADAAGQQLTLDALSDYSPAVAAHGGRVAFQRSRPVSVAGVSILDGKLIVAPFDGHTIASNQTTVADGFAANLSPDGAWIGYLQQGEPSPRTTLQVRSLTSGQTTTVSRTATRPVWSNAPVDWASVTMAWSPTGDDLFFVDQPDVSTIRRYHGGDASPGKTLAKSVSATEFLRDLYVSPDNTRLAYTSASRDAVVVHVIDLKSGLDRSLDKLPGAITNTFGRGWLEDGLVVVDRKVLHEDRTGDLEVRIVNAASGQAIKAGVITNAILSTARLHAAKRALYVTRLENGVQNLYAFSLATGELKALTRNALPGVTFSGFSPVGTDALIGVREERRQDIWLIQESSTKRPGNPAGR